MTLMAMLLTLMAMPFAFAVDWQKYVNEESGFSVDYPANLFSREALSDEGSGVTFKSTDGKIEFRAYSFNNGDELPLSKIRDIILADLDGREVTYKKSKKSWIVLSGYEASDNGTRDVFYQRLQASADMSRFSVFEIIYPETEKKNIDGMIKRMSTSLTAPKNLSE